MKSRFLIAALAVCCFTQWSIVDAQKVSEPLTLEDCLEMALERSQHRTVSTLSVHIAEAQHDQATSSYWPQVDLTSAFTRLNEDPVFVQPEETSSYTVSDFLPTPIEMQVTVPDQVIKVLNKNDFRSSVDFLFPLYTGGKRRGIVQQASAGVDAARQAVRKTDLQISYDVKRYYYGGVLASRLAQTAEDALARLEVTLDLTENLYKRGSGSVTKTDFLKHKMIVESLRGMLVTLEEKEDLARMALGNAIGLGWEEEVQIAEASGAVRVRSPGAFTSCWQRVSTQS